ncbi:hypothetical protein C8J57DRAFT_1224085 [Mycena rebaudengoi]|nr:hypothetical protein C8J57DRAFT_1224085 [Mycena rebaudengoi]
MGMWKSAVWHWVVGRGMLDWVLAPGFGGLKKGCESNGKSEIVGRIQQGSVGTLEQCGESRGETMRKASNAVYKWRAVVTKIRILNRGAVAQHLRNVEWMRCCVEENGERLYGGDTTKGDETKNSTAPELARYGRLQSQCLKLGLRHSWSWCPDMEHSRNMELTTGWWELKSGCEKNYWGGIAMEI